MVLTRKAISALVMMMRVLEVEVPESGIFQRLEGINLAKSRVLEVETVAAYNHTAQSKMLGQHLLRCII